VRDTTTRIAFATLLAILAPAPRALAATPAPTATASARTVRVFTFETLPLREALTLLRRDLRIASVATIDRANRLVVGDVAEKVDRAEELLRARDPALRARQPHPPLDLERFAEDPAAQRSFSLTPGSVASALVVARSVYGVRDARPFFDTEAVSLRAAPPVLDAIEALYRELGLLPAADEAAE